MPITDTKAKTAKSSEKPYKIQDTGGLYLLISPSEVNTDVLIFALKGKEKL